MKGLSNVCIMKGLSNVRSPSHENTVDEPACRSQQQHFYHTNHAARRGRQGDSAKNRELVALASRCTFAARPATAAAASVL